MGVRRRSSVILGVAAAALICVGAPAQARPHAIVRSTARITSFGQSQSTLAWRTHASAEIRLKNLRTGTHASFAMFPRPTDPTVCIVGPESAFVRGIAVGNTRAIWRWNAFAEGSGCGGGDAITLHAVSTVAINESAAFHLDDWWQQYCPVNAPDTMYIGAVDAGGSLSAFSTVHQACPGGTATGAVTMFDGTHQFSIPGSPPAARLSVSSRRIAWIAASAAPKLTILGEPSGQPVIAPDTPIEVYDTEGAPGVITTVTPVGTVQSIALAGERLAALVRRVSGTKVIIRYHIPDGERIGATKISSKAAAKIDMAGKRILYTVGHRVKTMDATTGHTRLVVTTSNTPFAPSIAGRRVAWVTNTGHSGRIMAVNLR